MPRQESLAIRNRFLFTLSQAPPLTQEVSKTPLAYNASTTPTNVMVLSSGGNVSPILFGLQEFAPRRLKVTVVTK